LAARDAAGTPEALLIFRDFLTLKYEQEKLSRYSVEWQPDDGTSPEWAILASIGTRINLLEPRTLATWRGRVVSDHS